jgi:hypothetical protein
MDGNGNGHKNMLGWMHNWMGSPNFDYCMNGYFFAFKDANMAFDFVKANETLPLV